MKVSEIKTAEPFNKIFPISDKVLAAVVMDMRKNGFDPCHPVIVWKGKNTVIDGHTRLEAAHLVGLQDIPIIERDFQDEDAAVEYAIRCQRERRNLTDADIARLVEELDLRHQRGGDHTSEKAKASSEAIAPAGKSADETARIIGTSRAKVEKVRAIKARAVPEVKAAVEAGIMSINAGYKTTRKNCRDPLDTTKDVTDKDMPDNKDSGTLFHLKRYWRQAYKSDKNKFKKWITEYPATRTTRAVFNEAGKEERLPSGALKHPRPPLNGMQFARMAIMDLEQIRPDDMERDEAFCQVKEWLRTAQNGGGA